MSGRRALGPVAAAVTAVAVHLFIAVRLHHTPFGLVGRAVGDYGPQYLPFHIWLRDLVNGQALGSTQFSWTLGAGLGTLPEYTTYLAGPFTPLVGLFPAHRVEVGILVVSLLAIALAAAAMTTLLQVLRPHAPRLLAACLGIGWACSSWVVQMGINTPQWLDGLWAFPLLCLTGLWVVRRGALLGPVALVALAWWSNFYVAMMASIAAGIFLLAWLVAGRRRVVAGLVAFALRGGLGVGLTAFLVWPTFGAIQHAADSPFHPLRVPLDEITLRLFGFTAMMAFHPMLFAGTLVLLACAALPAARHLVVRSRIVWTAVAVLGVLSFQGDLGIRLFSGGDIPNGNAYRWSFVIIGLLIIAGWHAVAPRAAGSRGPWFTGPQLLIASVVVGVVVWFSSDVSEDLTHVTASAWWLAPFVGVALLAAQNLLARTTGIVGFGRPTVTRGLSVFITALVILELAWSGTVITPHARQLYAVADPLLPTGQAERSAARATLQGSGWPTYRVSEMRHNPLPRFDTPNAGMRYDLPLASAYSSTLPGSVEQTLGRLGMTNGSRTVLEQPHLLGDAVLVLGAHWDAASATVVTTSAFPMVRTVTSARATTDDPTTNWASLFSRPVVTPATVTLAWDDGQPLESAGIDDVISRPERMIRGTVGCRVGVLTLKAPSVRGKALWLTGASGPDSTSLDIVAGQGQFLDTVAPAGQSVGVRYKSTDRATTSRLLALCVDAEQLASDITETHIPQISVDGATISASWSSPQTGDLVIATTAQPGWTCRVDGRRAEVADRYGLLAVAGDGAHDLQCSYRTPGLTTGQVLSGLTPLLVTLALAGLRRALLTRGRR